MNKESTDLTAAGGPAAASTTALADGLFEGEERLGWEFRPPPPATPFPHPRPAWSEPPQPDLGPLARERSLGAASAARRLAVVAGACLVLVPLNATLGSYALVLGAWWVAVPVLVPAWRLGQARQDAERARAGRRAEHDDACRAWEAAAAAHGRAEERRRAEAPEWYPLRPHPAVDRVDVFGGTPFGWATLLVTIGSSSLRSGAGVLVVDLTEDDVAAELADLATARGIPTTEVRLPADRGRLALLDGLAAGEAAELVADALHTRDRSAGGEGRAFDTDVVAAVVRSLDRPLTFGRLVAGLDVLARTSPPLPEDVRADAPAARPLSTVEVARLTAEVDLVAAERDQRALRHLRTVLEALARAEAEGAPAEAGQRGIAGVLGEPGLSVVAVSVDHVRHKDALARLVVHRVAHELRHRSGRGAKDVLVVAGADPLDRDALEHLARRARRCGLRLVLLVEHLRGDLQDVAGGGDSATVFMRLGNAQEAERAARQVGRGHRFVLSQLSRQVGTTTGTGATDGYGTQRGDSVGSAHSRGLGWGNRGGGSAQDGWSSSVTSSRSASWQATVSRSTGTSAVDGTTTARTYDFVVEPTSLQSLPPTAFFLVGADPLGRRAVLADCNPGITLHPRVSPTPAELAGP